MLIDREGNILRNQSVNFYRKCIKNKLGIEEFRFKVDGTTHLKLAALPALMDITKITKITGDYNYMRPYLLVDKVVGGVNFCLGLSKEEICIFHHLEVFWQKVINLAKPILTDTLGQKSGIDSSQKEKTRIEYVVFNQIRTVNANRFIALKESGTVKERQMDKTDRQVCGTLLDSALMSV